MTDLHDGPAPFDEAGLWATDALLDALAAGVPVVDDPAAELLSALVADLGDAVVPDAVPLAAPASLPEQRRVRRRRLAPRTGIAGLAVIGVLSTGGVAAASVGAGPTSPLFPLHQVLTGGPQLDGSQRQALEVKRKLHSAAKALAAGKVSRAAADIDAAEGRLPKIKPADGQRDLAAAVSSMTRQVSAGAPAPTTTTATPAPGTTSSHPAKPAPTTTAAPTPVPTTTPAPRTSRPPTGAPTSPAPGVPTTHPAITSGTSEHRTTQPPTTSTVPTTTPPTTSPEPSPSSTPSPSGTPEPSASLGVGTSAPPTKGGKHGGHGKGGGKGGGKGPGGGTGGTPAPGSPPAPSVAPPVTDDPTTAPVTVPPATTPPVTVPPASVAPASPTTGP